MVYIWYIFELECLSEVEHNFFSNVHGSGTKVDYVLPCKIFTDLKKQKFYGFYSLITV